MRLRRKIREVTYNFDDLRDLLAKASPYRSGDALAGVAAESDEQRAAAQMTLADLPLRAFLQDALIPYETDEVTRLIVDSHDLSAFAPVGTFTVGDFRDWLLSDAATGEALAALGPGLTPEMAAAVSKLMRVQDLVLVARKIRVVTQFRTTVGLPRRLSTRLQPNHPVDDPAGIAAAMVDGLLLGSGDAVIGINPASDNVKLPRSLEAILEAADKADAVAIGPGLGRSEGTVELVRLLLEQLDLPVVLDADGLWGLEPFARKAPTVLTPHSGELAALLGIDSHEVDAHRLDAVRRATARFGSIVLLKGADTLVAAPREGVLVATYGTPALATAGSGDVLTGIVAAYLSKGMEPRFAAAAAAVAHGVAAELVESQPGMIASDLLPELRRALAGHGLQRAPLQ